MYFSSSDASYKVKYFILGGVALATSLITSPRNAHADSTFLLQLGTSSSEAEANQKWNDLKAKNGDLLGKLTLHVAEVALPPNNTISYRTQAGPITSHDQAAKICSTLQTRGANCYVVETALFTSAPAEPTSTVASSAPLPAPELAPAVTSTPANPPAASVTATALANLPPVSTPPVSTPNLPAAPAATPAPPAAVPAAPVPVASVPVASAPPAMTKSEIAPPPAPPAPPASIPVPEPLTPTPPAIVADNTTPLAAPAPKHHHRKPHPAPQPAPAAAPLAPHTVIAGREPRFLDTGAPMPGYAAPAPAPPVQPVAPPPVVAMAPPAPPTAPPAQPAKKPGFFSRMFGSNPPQSSTPAATGNVNVSEAIRVPLSNGTTHSNATLVNLPPIHGMGGFASQNSHRTFWAQLSYFPDDITARNFYIEFTTTYPQFADGTRVRVTHPYVSNGHAGRVSLRMGPFATTDDINTVCIAATARGLRCTTVRDVGASTAANAPRLRTSYYGDQSRAGSEISPGDQSLFWVQLGTYPDPTQAWEQWQTLRASSGLLTHVPATVTSPPMSSSPRPVFRLRAGPFAHPNNADALCARLQAAGISCIVLNDR